MKSALFGLALAALLLAASADTNAPLIDFYNAQPPAGQAVLLAVGWNINPASNPCTWPASSGVHCTNNAVTHIRLDCPALGGILNGKLTDTLAKYKTLQTLAITSCAMVGGIPAGWTTTAAFSKLTYLNLRQNRLTGQLPALLGIGMSSLQNMDLSNNYLDGLLPKEWASAPYFPKLQYLNLAGNPLLKGNFPDLWGMEALNNWPDTLRVNICFTSVKGPIPAIWTTKAMQIYGEASSSKMCGALPPNYVNPALAAGVYPCTLWPSAIPAQKLLALPIC